MTHIGLLDSNGELTQPARERFIAEVLMLLQNGNRDGKGMRNILTEILPIPPTDPTPSFIDPITGAEEQLFYFGPDPFAPLMLAILPDKTKCPTYHAIWLDGMFAGIAKAFNVEGAAVAPPVMDPTIAFPNVKLPDPIKLPILTPPEFPKFLAELMAAPEIPKFIAEFTAKLPDILPPLPKFPELPSIPMPDMPGMPELALPKITIELLTALFPKIFVPAFLIDLITKLPDLPGGLFKFVWSIVFDLLVEILKLIPIPPSPKSLIATLLVTLKNIVVMVIVDCIGLAIGAGAICKLVATVFGLV